MSFQRSPSDTNPILNRTGGNLSRRMLIQIPGYEIKGEIGRGGMATVYRAVQHSLDRQVAIKVLAHTPDEQDEFALRFKKEGRILARLLHPNIVTIHDIGISEENQLFLSMEYLSEGTLRDQIKLGLSSDLAMHVIRAIAKALGYAHEQGVVHRDVKPSNIMFRHDGTPVLTDFGVAHIAGSSTVHTMTGLMVGSPGYMSPEQAMGQSATIQSDLYGLGVVLYEMLTGHSPYQADHSLAVLMKHLHDPIPVLPREHANLQPVLDRLMAKKPTDRYRDVDEFLTALNFIIPSDTGPQPKAITGTFPQTSMEFASGVLRSLWLVQPRRLMWLGLFSLVVLLAIAMYAFRSKIASVTDEAASNKTATPVTNTTAAPPREAVIATLLQQAEEWLQAGLLTDEAEQSAEAAYRRVLKLDRGNAQALAGLEQIASEYERLARQRLEAGMPRESLAPIQKGLAVTPDRESLQHLQQEAEHWVAKQRVQEVERKRQQEAQAHAAQLLTQAHSNLIEGALEASLEQIEKGLLAVPHHSDLLALREQVKAQLAEQTRQRADKLQEAANQSLARAIELQHKGEWAASLQQIQEGLSAVPNHIELLRLQKDVQFQWAEGQKRQVEQFRQQQAVKGLLEQAEEHFKAGRLAAPVGKNAQESYRRVLKLDAGNAQAQVGLERIAQDYLQRARQRQAEGALQESLKFIEQGLTVLPQQAELLRLREEVRTQQAAVEQQKKLQQRQEKQQRREKQQEQPRQEEQQQLEQQRKEEKQQKQQQKLEQQHQEEKRRQEQKKQLEEKRRVGQQQQDQQREFDQQLREQQHLEQRRRKEQRQEEKQRQDQQQRRLEQQRLEQQREEEQRKEKQRKLEQQLEESRPQKPTQPEIMNKPRVFGTF